MARDFLNAPDTKDASTREAVTATTVGTKRALDVNLLAGETIEATEQFLAVRIDEASATVTYIGKALPGVVDAGATWQIKKISVSGNVTSITFADGDDEFDNVWDNRAALVYS